MYYIRVFARDGEIFSYNARTNQELPLVQSIRSLRQAVMLLDIDSNSVISIYEDMIPSRKELIIWLRG